MKHYAQQTHPPSGTRNPRRICPGLVQAAVLAAAAISPHWALAHDAKTGWEYPYSCCSGYDCREVPANAISERRSGYVINGTGEVVAYSDRRIRQSPDGLYHWCSVAGANDGRTICLFVPPKSF